MTNETDFEDADYVEYETGKFAVCVYIKGSD
jgi:hypothetical protein